MPPIPSASGIAGGGGEQTRVCPFPSLLTEQEIEDIASDAEDSDDNQQALDSQLAAAAAVGMLQKVRRSSCRALALAAA